MTAYYNEIDPYAAEWLRNLVSQGLIAPGDVDERSIEDVRPDDLEGYTQCHFFAGIGVWSYALRLAGWPDDRPVWTGSCPCQPFSAAGKRGGVADERHLWPAFFHLIEECRPPVVLGEQVASKDGLGWLDLVQADLEAARYASAAVDLCAAGVGAPHIRQRLWWVAERLADTEISAKRPLNGQSRPGVRQQKPDRGCGVSSGLDDATGARYERQIEEAEGHPRDEARVRVLGAGCRQDRSGRPGPANGFWRDADWLFCRDGKWRPVEPGTFPLAHGAPARVGRLRAYGNAIDAQATKHFIEAYIDTRGN